MEPTPVYSWLLLEGGAEQNGFILDPSEFDLAKSLREIKFLGIQFARRESAELFRSFAPELFNPAQMLDGANELASMKKVTCK